MSDFVGFLRLRKCEGYGTVPVLVSIGEIVTIDDYNPRSRVSGYASGMAEIVLQNGRRIVTDIGIADIERAIAEVFASTARKKAEDSDAKG
jgi:hypothetical protein